MSTSFHSILKRGDKTRIVEIKRRIKDTGTLSGFVVGWSESLLLFHVLDTDSFRLNGYTAVRMEDVSQYRFLPKGKHWIDRATKHYGIEPVPLNGISVATIADLLRTASERYPLITIHPEKKKPDVCYIGAFSSMSERIFTIEDLNCNCEWSGPRRIRFEDVTRVSFGDGYAEALAVTAPKRGA